MPLISVPLRLEIAGSFTDLPNYRRRCGGHIALPLKYYVNISVSDYSAKSDNCTEIYKQSNAVAQMLGVQSVGITVNNQLMPASGLGTSSAILVGIARLYSNLNNLNLSDVEIAEIARNSSVKGIAGIQDEYCAAIRQPLRTYYNNNIVTHETFSLSEEFRQRIETWRLYYIPRLIPGYTLLEIENRLRLNYCFVNSYTEIMYKAIKNDDWNCFWKAYLSHWNYVESVSPLKVTEEIKCIRANLAGSYIRPCGAGAGGYQIIHGNCNLGIPVKIIETRQKGDAEKQ